MEIKMFSRNEKYGQALHLVYGFNIEDQKSAAKSSMGFWTELKTFFGKQNDTTYSSPAQTVIEIDLDRSSIEQAVSSELRNVDAAANENQQELFKGKIA